MGKLQIRQSRWRRGILIDFFETAMAQARLNLTLNQLTLNTSA